MHDFIKHVMFGVITNKCNVKATILNLVVVVGCGCLPNNNLANVHVEVWNQVDAIMPLFFRMIKFLSLFAISRMLLSQKDLWNLRKIFHKCNFCSWNGIFMLLMMVIVVPYLTPSIDSYNHCNDSSQDLMNIYETLINFIAS